MSKVLPLVELPRGRFAVAESPERSLRQLRAPWLSGAEGPRCWTAAHVGLKTEHTRTEYRHFDELFITPATGRLPNGGKAYPGGVTMRVAKNVRVEDIRTSPDGSSMYVRTLFGNQHRLTFFDTKHSLTGKEVATIPLEPGFHLAFSRDPATVSAINSVQGELVPNELIANHYPHQRFYRLSFDPLVQDSSRQQQ